MGNGFFIRPIRKDGTIIYKRKRWQTDGNVDHLYGRFMVFYTYSGQDDRVHIWGTPEFFYCPDPDNKIGGILWTEMCEILGRGPHPSGTENAGGMYRMVNHDEGFVEYHSRGIEVWKPVVKLTEHV